MMALLEILGAPILTLVFIGACLVMLVVTVDRADWAAIWQAFRHGRTPASAAAAAQPSATFCPACLCQAREHELDVWDLGAAMLCRTHELRMRKFIRGDEQPMVRAGLERYAYQSAR